MAGPRGAEKTPRTDDKRPRVGRPTAARVEAIEAQILDAAYDLFFDLGFEQTSIEAIALRAGVSKGTLYARYTNKSALLRAVYQRQSEGWLAQQQVEMGPMPEAFVDRLKHHARRIMESLGSREIQAFRQLVRRAGGADAEVVRVFLEVGYAPSIDQIAADFETGARQMGLSPRNTKRVAEMFMASLMGWHAIHEFRGAEATPQEAADFADQVVKVVLAGAAAW